MAQIVSNIIQNSLSGMVSGAVTTVGNYAGEAVNGVGNLIEAKGNAVGGGLAKRFEGWGNGVSAYGNSVRSATAPNAGYSGYPTAVKKAPVTASKKSEAGAKKAPSTTGAKKPLPSIPERKLLTAPSTKSVPEKGPVQGTYNKSVAPYKQGAAGKQSAYAPSTAAVSAVTTRTNKTANRSAGKLGNAKLNQAQKTLSPIKSATNAAGKVVPDKRSVPGKGGKTPSVIGGKSSYNEPYKGPIPLGGNAGSGDSKPKYESKYQPKNDGQSKAGYQGPLNLGGFTGGSGPKSVVNGQKSDSKAVPSKPASVSGGAAGAKPGGYGGPLNLGSLG